MSTSASRTTRWRWPRCSTPRTPSTAAAAAPRTSTTTVYLGTSRPLPLPVVRTGAARSRRSPPSGSSSRAPAPPRSGCAPRRAPRDVELPLPGLYNVYNALGAAALCLSLGIALDDVVAGLHAVTAAFGRAEIVRIADIEVSILLVKNPAGANEILRTLVLEPGELDLLAILNDRTADGRDVSWVWDADFEVLASRVRRVTCAGTRAAELALRFKYAGVPEDRLIVIPPLAAALDAAVADTAGRSAVRAADLHRAARAARGARGSRARGSVLGATGSGTAHERHLARPRVRELRRGSAAVALARRRVRRSGARRRRRHRPGHARRSLAPATA